MNDYQYGSDAKSRESQMVTLFDTWDAKFQQSKSEKNRNNPHFWDEWSQQSQIFECTPLMTELVDIVRMYLGYHREEQVSKQNQILIQPMDLTEFRTRRSITYHEDFESREMKSWNQSIDQWNHCVEEHKKKYNDHLQYDLYQCNLEWAFISLVYQGQRNERLIFILSLLIRRYAFKLSPLLLYDLFESPRDLHWKLEERTLMTERIIELKQSKLFFESLELPSRHFPGEFTCWMYYRYLDMQTIRSLISLHPESYQQLPLINILKNLWDKTIGISTTILQWIHLEYLLFLLEKHETLPEEFFSLNVYVEWELILKRLNENYDFYSQKASIHAPYFTLKSNAMSQPYLKFKPILEVLLKNLLLSSIEFTLSLSSLESTQDSKVVDEKKKKDTLHKQIQKQKKIQTDFLKSLNHLFTYHHISQEFKHKTRMELEMNRVIPSFVQTIPKRIPDSKTEIIHGNKVVQNLPYELSPLLKKGKKPPRTVVFGLEYVLAAFGDMMSDKKEKMPLADILFYPEYYKIEKRTLPKPKLEHLNRTQMAEQMDHSIGNFKFPYSESVYDYSTTFPIFVKPGAKELIQKLIQHGYEVVIWSRRSEHKTNTALHVIDPELKLVPPSHRFYFESHADVNPNRLNRDFSNLIFVQPGCEYNSWSQKIDKNYVPIRCLSLSNEKTKIYEVKNHFSTSSDLKITDPTPTTTLSPFMGPIMGTSTQKSTLIRDQKSGTSTPVSTSGSGGSGGSHHDLKWTSEHSFHQLDCENLWTFIFEPLSRLKGDVRTRLPSLLSKLPQ